MDKSNASKSNANESQEAIEEVDENAEGQGTDRTSPLEEGEESPDKSGLTIKLAKTSPMKPKKQGSIGDKAGGAKNKLKSAGRLLSMVSNMGGASNAGGDGEDYPTLQIV
jgi:hypothetical protein